MGNARSVRSLKDDCASCRNMPARPGGILCTHCRLQADILIGEMECQEPIVILGCPGGIIGTGNPILDDIVWPTARPHSLSSSGENHNKKGSRRYVTARSRLVTLREEGGKDA
jgi:hypothetical protein